MAAMLCSMNFLTKRELRRAVLAGEPVVLYNPVLGMPVINGNARVIGPWFGTRPPVEELKDHGHAKQRERVNGWHADVRVKDMRITEVR